MSADTQTTLSAYIDAVSSAYATGKATEHSYRPAIKALIEGLAPVFRASDVRAILTRRRSDKSFVRDPMVHFYEDFLRDYDAALRRRSRQQE